MCTMRPKYQGKEEEEIGEEKREETDEKKIRKNIQRGKSTSFCHKLEPVIMG